MPIININIRSWPTRWTLTVIALSVVASSVWSQQPQAARIGTIRSVAKPKPAIVRGQTPDYQALQTPSFGRTTTDIPLSAMPTEDIQRATWLDGPLPNNPEERLHPIVPPVSSSATVGSTIGGFTDAILNGTPFPTLGRSDPPSLPVMQMQYHSPPTAPQATFATPPAYRWYGYGTPRVKPVKQARKTTPPSDEWYAQTGATPGAFPNPIVMPEDAEPPLAKAEKTGSAIVTRSADIPETLPQTVTRNDSMVTIPVPPIYSEPTAPRVLVETGTPALPSEEVIPVVSLQGIAPTISIPPATVPPITPAVSWESVNQPTKAWQPRPLPTTIPTPPRSEHIEVPTPAQPTLKPFLNVGNAIKATDEQKPRTLQTVVADAVKDKARVTAIQHEHARSIVIRLQTKNEADGEAAIDAISAIDLLQPYRIRFELQLVN